MSELEKNQAKVGVSILVKKGDRILLEKRQGTTHGNGTWGPASGHIDYGESPEQTAIRETQEETGISITDLKFRVITNDIFEAERVHYITVWFDANYVSGEATVKSPKEESEVGWFTWDALPQPLFLPLQNLLNGNTYPSQATEREREYIMTQNAGQPLRQVEMQQCAQDCLNCHAACTQAAEKYRQSGDQSHAYMLLDCGDMCLTTAHFLEHNSLLYGYVCQACAQVANHCANMCEQMGDADSANACRNCAESCQNLTKLVP